MRARFIGTDGSLGLRHGRIYNIKLFPSRYKLLIVQIKTDWISDTVCPYETLMGFYKNWEILE